VLEKLERYNVIIAHRAVQWKRLYAPIAIPFWLAALSVAWNMIEAIHTLAFVADHLRWLTTLTGNVFLIVFGFIWLALILFWPSHKEPTHPAEAPKLSPLDATVKDYDPKLEVRFVDDRYVTMLKDDYAYFEFINRGRSEAKFACMEHFQIGGLGYRVKFLKTDYEIPPDHSSKSIYLEIERAENQPKLDIFDAFYREWEALNRPQLDELKIHIKVTYQDAVRNLFETRCELVFYPGAYVRKTVGAKVIETRNHKFRKVAEAIPRINWENC